MAANNVRQLFPTAQAQPPGPVAANATPAAAAVAAPAPAAAYSGGGPGGGGPVPPVQPAPAGGLGGWQQGLAILAVIVGAIAIYSLVLLFTAKQADKQREHEKTPEGLQVTLAQMKISEKYAEESRLLAEAKLAKADPSRTRSTSRAPERAQEEEKPSVTVIKIGETMEIYPGQVYKVIGRNPEFVYGVKYNQWKQSGCTDGPGSMDFDRDGDNFKRGSDPAWDHSKKTGEACGYVNFEVKRGRLTVTGRN